MTLPLLQSNQTASTKPSFFDSQICKSQLNCSLCRSFDDSGKRFRQTVQDNYAPMPFEFACPFGKQWNVRHSAPSRVEITDIAKPVIQNAVKPRFRIGDYIAYVLAKLGIHKKQGCNCQKRQDFLNKYSGQIITAISAAIAVLLFCVWI